MNTSYRKKIITIVKLRKTVQSNKVLHNLKIFQVLVSYVVQEKVKLRKFEMIYKSQSMNSTTCDLSVF